MHRRAVDSHHPGNAGGDALPDSPYVDVPQDVHDVSIRKDGVPT